MAYLKKQHAHIKFSFSLGKTVCKTHEMPKQVW